VNGSTTMERRAALAGVERPPARNHHAPPPIRTSNAAIPIASSVSAQRFFAAVDFTPIAGFVCAGTPMRSE